MRWTKNENVIWEELDGGALLIDKNSGSLWRLGADAAAAWKFALPGAIVAFESPTVIRFQSAGVGNGPRRRPSPRGNSGPG